MSQLSMRKFNAFHSHFLLFLKNRENPLQRQQQQQQDKNEANHITFVPKMTMDGHFITVIFFKFIFYKWK